MLGESWRAIHERQAYDDAIGTLLGEMTATVALLAQGQKSGGSLILQLQGDGAVRSAMVECREGRLLRGLARPAATGDTEGARGLELAGDGRLAITLQAPSGHAYQGLVAIAHRELSRCVEEYFSTSEQLPTRLWLASSATRASGVLLQRLPAPANAAAEDLDDIERTWRATAARFDALPSEGLLAHDARGLLARLAGNEALRLAAATPTAFSCSCSRERSSNALRLMGRDEVRRMIEEDPEVTVTCEFCGTTYRYDSIDAEMLFAPVG